MKLPIIYVRGYAGGTKEIDKAVDDPFYGFNAGSVHVRVGGDTNPHFYQFESPMLRLLTEEHDEPGETYQLLVRGGQAAYLRGEAAGSVPPMTIWVHRFYDDAASSFGPGKKDFSIEAAAADLFELVLEVKAKTGAPRVHLVAHSMGGLICRSMIQRVIPDATGRPDGAVAHVQSLFTYGTPHGGIEFSLGHGLLEKVRDAVDINGASIFGPERMYEYLTPTAQRADGPPEGWNPASMPADGFPVDRVFCLVGTDPEDYAVAFGLSSAAVGARSDGLVQIDNAYVPGAHRAFVHRSHSGRFGMVNSEEGYQNLKRFLFGDVKVTVELRGVSGLDRSDDIVWQLETQLAIRGLPILMHEQTTAHHCPIQIELPARHDDDSTPVPLLTTFLSRRQAAANRALRGDEHGPLRLRHALSLRLISLQERNHLLRLDRHLEQISDWNDTLVVDIEPAGDRGHPRAWARWNTEFDEAIRDWQDDGDPIGQAVQDSDGTVGVWRAEVALPPLGRRRLGDGARLVLTVTGREEQPGPADPAPVVEEHPERPGKTRRRWLW
jgi:hypothetical protein